LILKTKIKNMEILLCTPYQAQNGTVELDKPTVAKMRTKCLWSKVKVSVLLFTKTLVIWCNKRKLVEIKYDSGQIKKRYYERKDWEGNYVKHGTVQMWQRNGMKAVKSHFRNGKLHGSLTAWHPNGVKRERMDYKNGKENGLWILWYENGKIRLKHHLKDNKLEGLCTIWYENGKKAKECICRADQSVEGSMKEWDEKGYLNP